ncbi:S-adenosylmethionine:tRNA ribosyltransferase-isomerase [Marinoscillum furvescens]|uniref:S-adenosylmethionine:tRNA ribosyltransferase-isomerase n=1 Tax=Marinoscillum furvescens DSM 4134 TaxID=1122208 RepID=A0A3D9L2I9_MARFU|nr:S-adenosylmethionine:tRNA ribosyltransferase-isomerase [Marinoscillum furvescens]RED96999.1 S-adenosylmethionine:tRNA ribosyltransferase-isomerase [Marinoscillum furvescens DSM 4134]
MQPESLDLRNYTYELPDEKIAKYPLEDRASSKLLCYDNGQITHGHFRDISQKLPSGSFLVFNDTKVIPARLIFYKETGARIEIFLLDPIAPTNVYESVMSGKESCTWHAMIGNAKKWKEHALTMQVGDNLLKATRVADDQVKFEWTSDDTFSDVLTAIGKIPLPPYLGREATDKDIPRYQTIYSKHEGAVAAPTAGLHFTEEVMNSLKARKIAIDYLTLHVSAGTFQPIKTDNVADHPMHREQVVLSKTNIENLLNNDILIPVGTTSMRTMESLFWYGQLLSENPEAPFFVEKSTPYRKVPVISKQESLQNVLSYMERNQLETLIGHTEIFIYPGYSFKLCKGLITNFHLPGSTLILLVAALIGDDWRKVYQEALNANYRFLSYGDSSLLLPNQ